MTTTHATTHSERHARPAHVRLADVAGANAQLYERYWQLARERDAAGRHRAADILRRYACHYRARANRLWQAYEQACAGYPVALSPKSCAMREKPPKQHRKARYLPLAPRVARCIATTHDDDDDTTTTEVSEVA